MRRSPTTASGCAKQFSGACGALCAGVGVRGGRRADGGDRDPIPPLLRHCEARKFKSPLRNGDLQAHEDCVPDVRRAPACQLGRSLPARAQMLPPLAYPLLPAQCIMTRYCHTSINKRKCPVNALEFQPEGRRVRALGARGAAARASRPRN